MSQGKMNKATILIEKFDVKVCDDDGNIFLMFQATVEDKFIADSDIFDVQ